MHEPQRERQITFAPHGHILTNVNVWSPDSRRIVYDVRSDAAGDLFDGDRIETVDFATGQVRILYSSQNGAKCGVATYSPVADRVVFILGPDHPTPDFAYGASRRRGVMVDEASPGVAIPLDARDLTAPFTPGALRGGTHVHVFSPDGSKVSFTYEDDILAANAQESDGLEVNLRNVGVSVLDRPVTVPKTHPRNHDGSAFSVLVSQTSANPQPGSDAVRKAFEDGWVGNSALAFQGHVVTKTGETISEVFLIELPPEMTLAGVGPLCGTATTRPRPSCGTTQRRLTRTDDRRYPGLQGPRHWLRSSPDGQFIAFLMKDDRGIVQLFRIAPDGTAELRQITQNDTSIASAFTWTPDGCGIVHILDGSVCRTDVETGTTTRLIPSSATVAMAPRPEACVVSPDGTKAAYVRPVLGADGRVFNQIFICELAIGSE
jgi:Protein of unknown function (DUF3748)